MSAGLLALFCVDSTGSGFADKNWLNTPDKIWSRSPDANNDKRHCVMIGEQEVYLSANEFEVFYMLYLSPQITFTKEQIYEKIWHEPTNNHLHAVENTVFQIRKRLKPHCKGHEYIKTVVGYGYKFNSD